MCGKLCLSYIFFEYDLWSVKKYPPAFAIEVYVLADFFCQENLSVYF
ncbi:hypothetical protein CLW00_12114 [Mongoliibacter ruber]|uniref:Uncharacterized protein n=1 Tax=Mongoliibacter ruber TaxID=1750599 RepID=A0A2T0WCJ1_9BACT|nr:hypothetical protein CLW00_12114 [Mongoliibacter ruber]